MQVKILRESGYDTALLGLGLSFGITSGMSFWDFSSVITPEDCCETDREFFDKCKLKPEYERMAGRAVSLKDHDGGHNKYLRYCVLFLDVTMPRYWWAEADTYKVGTVAQSESTMHTIHKRDLTMADFELETALSLNRYCKP